MKELSNSNPNPTKLDSLLLFLEQDIVSNWSKVHPKLIVKSYFKLGKQSFQALELDSARRILKQSLRSKRRIFLHLGTMFLIRMEVQHSFKLSCRLFQAVELQFNSNFKQESFMIRIGSVNCGARFLKAWFTFGF